MVWKIFQLILSTFCGKSEKIHLISLKKAVLKYLFGLSKYSYSRFRFFSKLGKMWINFSLIKIKMKMDVCVSKLAQVLWRILAKKCGSIVKTLFGIARMNWHYGIGPTLWNSSASLVILALTAQLCHRSEIQVTTSTLQGRPKESRISQGSVSRDISLWRHLGCCYNTSVKVCQRLT